MANFDESIKIVLKHEGGYSNHPNDPGQETMRGITFNLFKRYADMLGVQPTVEVLKTLTEEQVKVIYKAEFWDKMQGDKFKSQRVADIVFDGYVNMGPRAIKMLQTEIGVESDGIVGPVTLSILNHANPLIVFEGYKDARVYFYKNLAQQKPNMKVFLNGWLNRINSFNYV